MAFEQARAGLEQAISTPPASQETMAPEGSGSVESTGSPESSAKTAAQSQIDDVLDLGKYDKFKFEGKEWTPDEIKRAILRQQDYTKKTQALAEERKSWESRLSEAKRFEANINADLEHCLKDPRLIPEFKKIYPPAYHAVLDRFLRNNRDTAAVDQQKPESTAKTMDPYLEARLASVEQNLYRREQADQERVYNSQVQANRSMLDSICDKLAKKYDAADEDAVLAQAEYLTSQLKPQDLDNPEFQKNWEDSMEKLFKQSHEIHLARYQARYKEQVEKQKQANLRGKDAAPGGSIPAQAPKKMKLKDVKDHILANIANNG